MAYKPTHELLDLQGMKKVSTGVHWCIKHLQVGQVTLVFTPLWALTSEQVEILELLHHVIQDRTIEVTQQSVIRVPFSFGEKFGWILGKVASFYLVAREQEDKEV